MTSPSADLVIRIPASEASCPLLAFDRMIFLPLSRVKVAEFIPAGMSLWKMFLFC
ncbi:hypothetical protein D3C71_1763940 [compost metagenome]